MTNPTEQFAAWNQAAYDTAMSYARASLASAEQLLRLNLDTARQTLEHNTRMAQELMSSSDPQQALATRMKMAETAMQQAAAYAQNVYEIVSQTQSHLTKVFEEQISRASKDMAQGASQLGKGAPAMPGADIQNAAVQSMFAATNAMMESLNKATKQFAELSESTIKAATAQMVKGTGKS